MSAKSSSTSTILEQHEIRLERQGEPVSIDRLKRQVTQDASWLTAYQPVVGLIQSSLDEQRAVQANMGLHRFHNLNDHTRRAAMQQRGPSLFYYAQRAWSLPYDYVSPPPASRRYRTTSDLAHSIDGLVFQVEHITDDLLISLGLMDESARLPSLDSKSGSERARLRGLNIEAKLKALPAFHTLLKGAVPLQTGVNGGNTGRILRIDGGRYLVFQEYKRAGSEKNKPYIHYAAKVYDTLYSLLRSQAYGGSGISENLESYTQIKMDLATLHTSWKMLSDDQREYDVHRVLLRLYDSQNPHIVRARERLTRIGYTNSETDNQRVLGAQNDIGQLLTTQESKKGAIGYHGALITHLVRSEETRFTSLRDAFIAWLDQLDASELMSYIDKKGDAKISLKTQNQIHGAMGVLNTYIRDYHLDHMIGHPFSEFGDRLANGFSYSRPLLDQIRLILQRVLAIKKQSYWLMLYQTQHHIKNGQEPKGSIATVIKEIKFLEEKIFLPNIDLTQSGIEKFNHLISNMGELARTLEKNDPDKSIEYIDSLIDEGYPE